MAICPICFRTLGTWTNDPILTPDGIAGSSYIGFTRILAKHITELQFDRNQKELALGLTQTVFSPVNITDIFQNWIIYITELRTSTEQILSASGLSLEDYFNYDESGTDMRPGNHQLNWNSPNLEAIKYQCQAIHLEDLRHYLSVGAYWLEHFLYLYQEPTLQKLYYENPRNSGIFYELNIPSIPYSYNLVKSTYQIGEFLLELMGDIPIVGGNHLIWQGDSKYNVINKINPGDTNSGINGSIDFNLLESSKLILNNSTITQRVVQFYPEISKTVKIQRQKYNPSTGLYEDDGSPFFHTYVDQQAQYIYSQMANTEFNYIKNQPGSVDGNVIIKQTIGSIVSEYNVVFKNLITLINSFSILVDTNYSYSYRSSTRTYFTDGVQYRYAIYDPITNPIPYYSSQYQIGWASDLIKNDTESMKYFNGIILKLVFSGAPIGSTKFICLGNYSTNINGAFLSDMDGNILDTNVLFVPYSSNVNIRDLILANWNSIYNNNSKVIVDDIIVGGKYSWNRPKDNFVSSPFPTTEYTNILKTTIDYLLFNRSLI